MKFSKYFIAYYRVSTDMQGESGLGIEAQKESVTRYINFERDKTRTLLNKEGDKMCLVREFLDIETGKGSNPIYSRKGLNEAILLYNKLRSEGKNPVILIAKLDRLSRNVSFISSLIESKIKFVACDMPDANDMTIHILSAVSQNEQKMISQRTKDALQIKKKQIEESNGYYDKNGQFRTRLGNESNFSNEGRKKGAMAMKMKILLNPDNIKAKSLATELRKQGFSLHRIANRLNYDGHRTINGNIYNANQVRRLLSYEDLKTTINTDNID